MGFEVVLGFGWIGALDGDFGENWDFVLGD